MRYNNAIGYKWKTWLIIIFVLLLVAAYLIFGVFMSPAYVEGESMIPTLIDGKMIFVQKALFKIGYNDIMIFKRPNEDYDCVKRVMGMPGDRVRINDGKLYINDQLANDIFVEVSFMEDYDEITLSDSEYFMLGDNRSNSADSRYYGAVPRDNFIGKCLFV